MLTGNLKRLKNKSGFPLKLVYRKGKLYNEIS